MQCGAVNGPEANTCCFCDARLPKNTHEDIPVRTSRSAPSLQSQNLSTPNLPQAVAQRVEGNLATAPDWHSEVSDRMEAYRARRRRLQGDSSQPEFTFEKPERSYEKITLAPAEHHDHNEHEYAPQALAYASRPISRSLLRRPLFRQHQCRRLEPAP